MLIDHGSDLNLQHGNGGTALMFAVMFGRNILDETLLKHGADKDIRDRRGLKAIDLAVQQGNVEAVDILELHSSELWGASFGLRHQTAVVAQTHETIWYTKGEIGNLYDLSFYVYGCMA